LREFESLINGNKKSDTLSIALLSSGKNHNI
jgi:hypothetical protein